jgi:ABC-type sugar transport system permease subunit
MKGNFFNVASFHRPVLLPSQAHLSSVLAIVIGRVLNHRLRGDGFYRYVCLLLIAIGDVLITQAFLS